MIDMVGRTRGDGQDQGRLAVSPAVTTRSSASGSNGGQRDGNALRGTFDRAGANQLVALLGRQTGPR
jgi:hypothetical protein